MRNKGFTLVEILIVVVILGILAAIVIPSFGSTSQETNLTNLKANLQTVRAQNQLYKAQHNDLYPGQAVAGGNVVAADFIIALTENDGTYGPYMNRMPVNPYIENAGNNTSITCVNNAAASPAGNEGTAWWFNASNGDFRACDSVDHIEE